MIEEYKATIRLQYLKSMQIMSAMTDTVLVGAGAPFSEAAGTSGWNYGKSRVDP